MSQTTASGAIRLVQPAAGATTTVPINAPNMMLGLGFAPDPNAVVKKGQDLEFAFEDGGKIVLQGYYDHFTNKTLPVMVTDTGDQLPGEQFLASLREDLLTAAGPAAAAAPAGGGMNAYGDDAGNLLDGVDRLVSLGTDQWGRGTEVPEQAASPGLATLAAEAPVVPPVDPPVDLEPPVDPPALLELSLGTVYEGALPGIGSGLLNGVALGADQLDNVTLTGLPAGWGVAGGTGAYGTMGDDGVYRLDPARTPKSTLDVNDGHDTVTDMVSMVLVDLYGRLLKYNVPVTIVDDAPTSVLTGTESDGVNDGVLVAGSSISGQFEITKGADAAAGDSFTVNGTKVTGDNQVIVDDANGKLVVNLDGNYIYTSNKNVTASDLRFEFRYQDSDGDSTDKTLVFDIVRPELPNGLTASATVFEVGLRDGASGADTSELGTINFANLPAGWTVIGAGAGTGESLVVDHNGNWSVQLLGNAYHNKGTNNHSLVSDKQPVVIVEDTSGNRYEVPVTVTIEDDTPAICTGILPKFIAAREWAMENNDYKPFIKFLVGCSEDEFKEIDAAFETKYAEKLLGTLQKMGITAENFASLDENSKDYEAIFQDASVGSQNIFTPECVADVSTEHMQQGMVKLHYGADSYAQKDSFVVTLGEGDNAITLKEGAAVDGARVFTGVLDEQQVILHVNANADGTFTYAMKGYIPNVATRMDFVITDGDDDSETAYTYVKQVFPKAIVFTTDEAYGSFDSADGASTGTLYGQVPAPGHHGISDTWQVPVGYTVDTSSAGWTGNTLQCAYGTLTYDPDKGTLTYTQDKAFLGHTDASNDYHSNADNLAGNAAESFLLTFLNAKKESFTQDVTINIHDDILMLMPDKGEVSATPTETANGNYFYHTDRIEMADFYADGTKPLPGGMTITAGTVKVGADGNIIGPFTEGGTLSWTAITNGKGLGVDNYSGNMSGGGKEIDFAFDMAKKDGSGSSEALCIDLGKKMAFGVTIDLGLLFHGKATTGQVDASPEKAMFTFYDASGKAIYSHMVSPASENISGEAKYSFSDTALMAGFSKIVISGMDNGYRPAQGASYNNSDFVLAALQFSVPRSSICASAKGDVDWKGADGLKDGSFHIDNTLTIAGEEFTLNSQGNTATINGLPVTLSLNAAGNYLSATDSNNDPVFDIVLNSNTGEWTLLQYQHFDEKLGLAIGAVDNDGDHAKAAIITVTPVNTSVPDVVHVSVEAGEESVAGNLGVTLDAEGYGSIQIGDASASWNSQAKEWEFTDSCSMYNGKLLFSTDEGTVLLDLESSDFVFTPSGGVFNDAVSVSVIVTNGDGDVKEGSLQIDVPSSQGGDFALAAGSADVMNSMTAELDHDSGEDFLVGGTGNEVLYGSTGADIFAWKASDYDGGTDTILDFTLGQDHLSFADIFGTPPSITQEALEAALGDTLSVTVTSDHQLTITVNGDNGASQTVDVHLTDAISVTNNSSDAEKASLLQQMLTNITG